MDSGILNRFIIACNSAAAHAISFVASVLGGVLPPFAGLILLSAAVGVLCAFFYGVISNEGRIKAVKNEIFASMHEAVLYRHDAVLTLKAQGALIFSGLKYLSTSFLPIAVLFVPSLILFSALQNYYGFTDRKTDSELTVTVSESSSPFDYRVQPASPEKISPPLRIPGARQLVYKLSPDGKLELVDKDGNRTDISAILDPKYSDTMTSSWLQALLYGSESPAPKGIESISVSKPFAEYSIGGVPFPWYVWSILFVLLGGFGAAKVFNITF